MKQLEILIILRGLILVQRNANVVVDSVISTTFSVSELNKLKTTLGLWIRFEDWIRFQISSDFELWSHILQIRFEKGI
jgi:hypothetical protein